MNNKNYYSFERNNYFYGKLLTVRDFFDEQKYFNDKRRINNFLTNGAGVVSGLNVVQIDDKTISIEAGMALDYQGREIVVEESITKKLNVINGFENLSAANTIYLCLAYDEEKTEAVHKIGKDGDELQSEFSRVTEGYRLYLTDEVDERRLMWMESLKTARQVIFDYDGVRITQSMPAFVRKHQTFDVSVTIEKLHADRQVEVDYIIQSDFLKSRDGQSYVRVYAAGDNAEKTTLHFQMTAEANGNVDAYIMMNRSDSRITIDDTAVQLADDIKMNFSITEKSPKEAVIEKYLCQHFDDVIKRNMEEAIYIAKFNVVHSKNEYSILSYEYLPFKQIVLSNQMLYLLSDEMERMPQPETEKKQVYIEKNNTEKPKKSMSHGTEEIAVDLRGKNKVYFSDEISHGLEGADVFISVAVHEPTDGSNLFEQDCTYFGNVSILKDSIFEGDLPPVETAVISYPQRGTFRIAVKPLEDIHNTVIAVKWQAESAGGSKKSTYMEENKVSVYIHPDTITLAPRETFKFNADVSGTDNVECRWSVTEENGGKIDMNGIYEAPAHEGVYEITAESVKYPNKKSTAFVVVREG